MIHYQDDWLTVLLGDCREQMQTLEPESVHCVVTSPPYWGLRDYGIGEQGLGLEPTPEAYVAAMVDVFREIKRVLRSDGTLWLNIGDGFTDKQLQGIPWRLAFALQADGWYLRSDIIWAKPNPMPESVTDRPTKSHEYLFLLTKSPRYYYDADAVREPQTTKPQNRSQGEDQQGTRRWHPGGAEQWNPAGRNLRTVWSIATQPYPGAHFATFPEALVEPCIKAGTSERGVCPECGAPWVREVERGELVPTREHYDPRPYGVVVANPDPTDQGRNRARDGHRANMAYENKTTGWRSTCFCPCQGECGWGEPHEVHEAVPIPATVLDPFAGSGTVGRVANRLSRRAILIDLSAEYLDQAMLRNHQAPLGLSS